MFNNIKFDDLKIPHEKNKRKFEELIYKVADNIKIDEKDSSLIPISIMIKRISNKNNFPVEKILKLLGIFIDALEHMEIEEEAHD